MYLLNNSVTESISSLILSDNNSLYLVEGRGPVLIPTWKYRLPCRMHIHGGNLREETTLMSCGKMRYSLHCQKCQTSLLQGKRLPFIMKRIIFSSLGEKEDSGGGDLATMPFNIRVSRSIINISGELNN